MLQGFSQNPLKRYNEIMNSYKPSWPIILLISFGTAIALAGVLIVIGVTQLQWVLPPAGVVVALFLIVGFIVRRQA